jgi:DNA-binding transcriptional MerR regulator
MPGKSQQTTVDPAGESSVDGLEEAVTLTLEELAERSGVNARTIRYYQAEKLLPKPERDREDGRIARYSTEHLERLRLIGELRDRGLRLPAIRTLLNEGDASTNVADWLGLDATLRGSWGNDRPRIVEQAELDAMLEGAPKGTLGVLEESGVLARQGDAWLLRAPGLAEITIRLVRDRVPVDLVIEAGNILEKHLSKEAEQLVDLFVEARAQGFGGATDTAALVQALRPIAGDAARIIFAQQLERSVEKLLSDTRRLGRR